MNEIGLYVLSGLFATKIYIDKQGIGLLSSERPEPG
jgi:hypothetical protein